MRHWQRGRCRDPDRARLPLPGAARVVVLFGLAYAAERGSWRCGRRSYAKRISRSTRSRCSSACAACRCVAAVFVSSSAWDTSASWRSAFSRSPRELGPPGSCRPAQARSSGSGGRHHRVRRGLEGCAEGRLRPREVLRSPWPNGDVRPAPGAAHRQSSGGRVASIGYERATAETYKTFFFPSKPRGKFAGKPVLFPGYARAPAILHPGVRRDLGARVATGGCRPGTQERTRSAGRAKSRGSSTVSARTQPSGILIIGCGAAARMP